MHKIVCIHTKTVYTIITRSTTSKSKVRHTNTNTSLTKHTTASTIPPTYFKSAGVNACTILVPSLNLVLKILFAF